VSQALLSLAPVVTTVIPTYRRPKLLRRAILSALGQTYPHVRVCVYDNASGDETEAVVRKLALQDSRVRYHRHQENIGSYPNFNFGIREVTTPYLSLLSDDDVLAPGFYEQAVQAFERYPKAMFVCMPTMAVNLELVVISPPLNIEHERFVRAGEGIGGMVDGSIPSKWSGLLFRKAVCDGIGGIDVAAGPYADAGYVFHAAARYPFVVVPGLAAVYVVHMDTTSGRIQVLDGTWPGWWERMIAVVMQDNEVPQFARDDMRRLIYPSFSRIAGYQILRALGEGHSDIARRAATGLRDCGVHVFASALDLLICTYDRVGVVRKVFYLVNRRKKSATKDRISELQVRCGHHVEFIRRLDMVGETTYV